MPGIVSPGMLMSLRPAYLGVDADLNSVAPPPGATGVIYCTDRAMANGFKYDDPEWANLVGFLLPLSCCSPRH